MDLSSFTRRGITRLAAVALLSLGAVAPAWAALTVTPITWNVIGLDSNNVNVGPDKFPVGVRICSTASTGANPIIATFSWDDGFDLYSGDLYLNLRSDPGPINSLSVVNIGPLGAGECNDAYFEVEVTRTSAAYGKTREYRVTAVEDTVPANTATSPTPREMFVERLVSQSRNGIFDMRVATSAAGLLPAWPAVSPSSVAAGGSATMLVGQEYWVQLVGGTATQGYEQLETFINFSNTIFNILEVSSSFAADSSFNVSSPADTLYFDACVWDNDPTGPYYRSCQATGKAGGAPVIITYRIRILSAGAGETESLNSLFHDFSGSSFHYNGDYDFQVRFINILDPTTTTVSKSFVPSAISTGATSRLRIVINNPNEFEVSGYSIIDNLPANLVVASTPVATTSGCGTPTFAPSANDTSLTFTGGTIAAGGSCTIGVNVTSSSAATYVNTTEAVLIGGVSTGKTATANLVVTTAPPAPTPTCGFVLASWTVPSTPNPPDLTGGFPTVKETDVTVATASLAVPASSAIATPGVGGVGDNAWGIWGFKNDGQRANFAVTTTNYSGVTFEFQMYNSSPANGPAPAVISYSTDNVVFTAEPPSIPPPVANTWIGHTYDFTGQTNPAGTTFFRISGTGANNDNSSAGIFLDSIIVRGCKVPQHPTVTKAFAAPVIPVDGTSTLTITLTNPNTVPLTTTLPTPSTMFSDALPAGVKVATPVTTTGTTCTGTWAPVADATTLTYSGGTIPASGSCVLVVNVTKTTPGAALNISEPIRTDQTGTNFGASGIATAVLTAIRAPEIEKSFSSNPVQLGTASTLTFTITNPNADTALSSVAFSDTFPVAPGAMVVATPSGATGNCGGGTWTTTAGAASVSLTNGALAAGASCTLTVNVTTAVAGNYDNVSGTVSGVFNGVTVTGNTANASLTVNSPRIGLLKQVGLSADGPWTSSLTAPSGTTQVYYRFTIENTGTVALVGATVTDPAPGVDMTACNGTWTDPLPVAGINDDGHIDTCVVGPVAVGGNNPNTALADATGAPQVSSTASYSISAAPPPVLNTTKSINANPVTLGGQAIYTVTVNNSGTVATTGVIRIHDDLNANLSYVSSSGTNWSCDGNDPLTCTYSGTLAANDGAPGGPDTTPALTITVNVGMAALNGDNTARASGGGDLLCAAPSGGFQPRCQAQVLAGTVPVTLSDVGVTVEGSQLVVQFGTAAEAGTLGFRVLGSGAGERTRSLLSDSMVVAAGSSFEARRYEVRGPYNGQTHVWIEEVATDSKSTMYGPYAIGSRTGERDLFVATDWTAVATEQTQFRNVQRAAVISRGQGSTEAELRIAATGWVGVRHEDLLAQGIDWSGEPASSIRLTKGVDVAAVRYEGPANFGPGSVVYFFAEAVTNNLYTATSVYRLSLVSQGARPMRTIFAGIGPNRAADGARDRFEHNPNRGYDLVSAHTDPWYAHRLVRNNVPRVGVDETFVLPEKVEGGSDERIEVGIWGGISFAQTPDHSVRLLLNGTEIATRRFDGLIYQSISVDLPQGLLVSGSNTLRMELVGDTGIFADIVYLDSIRVDYQKKLRAVDNRLSFLASNDFTLDSSADSDRIFVNDFNTDGVAACLSGRPGCDSYRVSGLSSNDINVIRVRSDGSVEQLTGAVFTTVAGGYELAFSAVQRLGDRYWVEPAAGSANVVVTPKPPVSDPLAGGPASYLVISHPSFISGLAPLVAARQAQGFSVRVINVEDLYDYFNQGVVDPDAIGAAIALAYERLDTRYVLLVGGDTYDYFNYLGANSRSFVPTYYRQTGPFVRHAPVDMPFADVDSDGFADVAIGRFPVRTAAELNAIIAKTLAYAQANHPGKLLRVSDRTLAVNYAAQLSSLSNVLGPATQNTVLALDAYPAGGAGVTQARGDLVSAVNAGQSLVTFFGHSAPGSWTNEGLVTAALVHGGLFNNASTPTVAWVLGCYGSYFVNPTYNTVAQALMVQANGGGAAAVLGASGLTNISSDVSWMTALRPHLRLHPIGEAVRMAQRTLQHAGPQYLDVNLGGVLLGDPALQVRQ